MLRNQIPVSKCLLQDIVYHKCQSFYSIFPMTLICRYPHKPKLPMRAIIESLSFFLEITRHHETVKFRKVWNSLPEA
jgi:hypothetical protein